MRERTDQSSREPRRTSCARASLFLVFFPLSFCSPRVSVFALFLPLSLFLSSSLTHSLSSSDLSPPACSLSLSLSREALFLRLILVSSSRLLRYLAWFLSSLPSPVIPSSLFPSSSFVRPAAWSKSLHLSLCFHPRASSLLRLSPAAIPVSVTYNTVGFSLSRGGSHTRTPVYHRRRSSPRSTERTRARYITARCRSRQRARAHTEPREYSGITCCCQTSQQRTVALNRRSPAREV